MGAKIVQSAIGKGYWDQYDSISRKKDIFLECFPFNVSHFQEKKCLKSWKTQPVVGFFFCPVKCFLLLYSSKSLAENMAYWCIFSRASSRTLFPFSDITWLRGKKSHWNLFISKRVEFGARYVTVFYQCWNVLLPQTDRELDSVFIHCQGFSISK